MHRQPGVYRVLRGEGEPISHRDKCLADVTYPLGTFLPGSEEKIQLMAERAGKATPLFEEDDAKLIGGSLASTPEVDAKYKKVLSIEETSPTCKHCQTRVTKLHSRNLCNKCYRDPSIRHNYPGKKNGRPLGSAGHKKKKKK